MVSEALEDYFDDDINVDELEGIIDEYLEISNRATGIVNGLGLHPSLQPGMTGDEADMPLDVNLVNDIELGNLRWRYTALAAYAGEKAADADSDATNAKIAYEEIRDIVLMKTHARTVTEAKAIANRHPAVKKARMLMLEKTHVREKIYSRLKSYQEKVSAMSREQARRLYALEKAKYSGSFGDDDL